MHWVSLWLFQEKEEKGPGLTAAPRAGQGHRRPCEPQAALRATGSMELALPAPMMAARLQEPGVLRAPETPWEEARATRSLALTGPESGSLRTDLGVN